MTTRCAYCPEKIIIETPDDPQYKDRRCMECNLPICGYCMGVNSICIPILKTNSSSVSLKYDYKWICKNCNPHHH